jgi:hypothetical protein
MPLSSHIKDLRSPLPEVRSSEEAPSVHVPRAGTKISAVIAMLGREAGATIDELVAETGWLPHTARAALTGLRKRGYALASDRSDRMRGTVYRIARGEADATIAAGSERGEGTSHDAGLARSLPAPILRSPPKRLEPCGRAAGPPLELAGWREMRTRKRPGRPDEGAAWPRGRAGDQADSSAELRGLVSSLPGLDRSQLLLQWRNHLGGTAPAHLPRWLLMKVLAYRLQAAALGDVDPATLRKLRSGAEDSGSVNAPAPFANRSPATREGIDLRPGAMLAREWRGRLERVSVLNDGFAWNGQTYGSLSVIAKAITGTSWNGHRFFGLKAGRPPRGKGRAGGSRG